jgi:predicted metal-dependent phosphoesterase TrpH
MQGHRILFSGLSARDSLSQSRTMGFRIDPHVHSFFSGDGVSSPEALIASAKKKGLDGIALTDHNTSDGCRYLLDEGLLREDGSPVDGFLVIPGVEVSTAEGHLLCLGVWLPNGLQGTPADEIIEMVHSLGGLAIPAHPYDRLRSGIRERVLDRLAMDGLEVFNAATTLLRHNRNALSYALRKDLPQTAGSDAHHHAAVGCSHTIFPARTLSTPAILASLNQGTQLCCQPMGPGEKLRKTIHNWFRFRRKRRYFGGATAG